MSLSSPPPSRKPLLRRWRVLLADDSKTMRDSIADFLRTLETVDLVAVCENGRMAMEQALRDPPDAVLLDLQMPVMSGLEAAQILRSCLPETAIIVTTVHYHAEVRSACLAGGADAFVAKAALVQEFEGALSRALAIARGRRDHGAAPDSDFNRPSALSSSRASASHSELGPIPPGAAEAKDVRHGSALPHAPSAPPLRRDP